MKVEVGSKYRHFKGMIVEVIAIAKDTETLEDLVIYSHDGSVWARPYDMFVSKVDRSKYPDVNQEYRFLKVYE
ncbi:MAG: DUF1653 domain-containing protein [Bacilli bacterium]|nr:DUF1653 domain-containing protein [Bacilli bacterium]